MLLGGGVSYLLLSGGGFGYGTLGGMMAGYAGMLGGYGTRLGSTGSLLLISLVAGPVVTIGALLLNSRPAEHVTWGALVLVFSLIGFLGMDGFLIGIGALLGVVGGVFALSWRPTREKHLH